MKGIYLLAAVAGTVSLVLGLSLFHLSQANEISNKVTALSKEADALRADLNRETDARIAQSQKKIDLGMEEEVGKLWTRAAQLEKRISQLETDAKSLVLKMQENTSARASSSERTSRQSEPSAPAQGEDAERAARGPGRMMGRGREFTERARERYLENLAEKLNLAEGQKQEVKRISDEMQKNIQEQIGKALQEGNFSGREGMRSIMEQAIAARDEQLKQVLTPEQFDALKKEESDSMGGHMFPSRPRREGNGEGQER